MDNKERIDILLLCCTDILSLAQLQRLTELCSNDNLIIDDNIIEKLEITLELIIGMNGKCRRKSLKYIDMILDLVYIDTDNKITRLDMYYNIVSRIKDNKITWSPDILDI
jgi:hypothetical protein